MAAHTLTPQSALFGLITGYHASCAVYVAARLGLADLLADGPRHYTDLAGATETHAPSLHRVLRLLVSVEVLTEDDSGRFALTPVGACLRSDVPDSLRAAALLWGGGGPQLAWSRLLACVQTGKPAFASVFGADPFRYMAQRHRDAAIFDQGMADLTRQTARAVVSAYDFSAFRNIVDVGGGNGTLLAGILDAYPTVRGILYDLPHVAERGREQLGAFLAAGRCQVEAGDFFEGVPGGGDAYLLSNVVTDWNDERAAAILRNCGSQMRPDGKLLVIEAIFPARIDPSPLSRAATSTDVNVMVCLGGRERSELDFRSLYDSAGFELRGIVPTSSRVCVIEGIHRRA